MQNKKKKDEINDACGCLIDDLIGESMDNSPNEEVGNIKKDKLKNQKNPIINSKRLCSARESDMEVYIDPDSQKVSYDFYMKKMTDGLPVIPPTREKVLKFLRATDQDPDEVIAILPPRQGKATVEKIAINSVMAGCLPAFMPVVQHAVQAVSQEKFNLPG